MDIRNINAELSSQIQDQFFYGLCNWVGSQDSLPFKVDPKSVCIVNAFNEKYECMKLLIVAEITSYIGSVEYKKTVAPIYTKLRTRFNLGLMGNPVLYDTHVVKIDPECILYFKENPTSGISLQEVLEPLTKKYFEL